MKYIPLKIISPMFAFVSQLLHSPTMGGSYKAQRLFRALPFLTFLVLFTLINQLNTPYFKYSVGR